LKPNIGFWKQYRGFADFSSKNLVFLANIFLAYQTLAAKGYVCLLNYCLLPKTLSAKWTLLVKWPSDQMNFFGQMTIYQKKMFGLMTFRSNNLSVKYISVKWSFVKKYFGQTTFFGKMCFRSNGVRLNYDSGLIFQSNGVRFNDFSVKKCSVKIFRWNDFSVKWTWTLFTVYHSQYYGNYLPDKASYLIVIASYLLIIFHSQPENSRTERETIL
jgi:hypothetical protein